MRVKSNSRDGRFIDTNSTETTSSSGSHARAVGLNNKLTGVNPALTFDLVSIEHSCSLADPKASAGDITGLLNDYLGLPYYSFLPRWEKERMRVCSYRKHTLPAFSDSNGFNDKLESKRKDDD